VTRLFEQVQCSDKKGERQTRLNKFCKIAIVRFWFVHRFTAGVNKNG